MSEGELLQIQKSRHLNLTEETYLQIIGDKTASLFSACTLVGAASVTDDPAVHRHLERYGEHVGMAFQIQDDLLDYLGTQKIIGKPTGIDIKEKKLTLPLIYALRMGDRHDARHALKLVKKGASNDDVRWIVDFVTRAGGLDYAKRRAAEFGTRAKEELSGFRDTEAKRSLVAFVDYVIAREK